MRVGIEVGGTFTDLVAVDADSVVLTKVPSTPEAPDRGAITSLVDAGIELGRVDDLVHGSTVATNALLERKGARVAFVTTAGFRDILFLQRHDRRTIYDLHYRKPEPVVRRRDCFEVAERCDAAGNVLIPLDENVVASALIPAIAVGDYAAVAICLLSAYANPAHEYRLQAMLRDALPRLFVTCSADVSREFREFERASTTSLAAYVQPVIDAYLDRLSATLTSQGFQGRFSMMQSNGGSLPAAAMRRNAITALFSGPAAGVIGAMRQTGRSGHRNLLTFDMGGTSTDVCLVTDGRPNIVPETEIDGLPVRTPVLDIVTVGAGGGSIVWMDEGDMLRAGPQSAGAQPGPACYGKGGDKPTITDAHVIRGTIRPEAFLGGTMVIFPDRSKQAFAPLAARLRMSVEQAATSVLRLATANIVRAIQLVSTERGHDPRDYALVPFGGAGPLLAAEIASDLGMSTVVVPPNPGVLSAYGLIASDISKIEGATRRFLVDDDAAARVQAIYEEMAARALRQFADYGVDDTATFTFTADMRFMGQAFEVPVELEPRSLAELTTNKLLDRFAQAHQRVYLHGGGVGQEAEIVGFRLGISRTIDKLPMFRERVSPLRGPRRALLHGEDSSFEVALIACSEMLEGVDIRGPALIQGYSSTTYVPSGWSASRDEHENVVLRTMD